MLFDITSQAMFVSSMQWSLKFGQDVDYWVWSTFWSRILVNLCYDLKAVSLVKPLNSWVPCAFGNVFNSTFSWLCWTESICNSAYSENLLQKRENECQNQILEEQFDLQSFHLNTEVSCSISCHPSILSSGSSYWTSSVTSSLASALFEH